MGRAEPSGGRPLVEVALPGVPGLGGLYARGLAASARKAVGARVGALGIGGRARGAFGAGGGLPDVAYLVRDVRADAERLTEYQHLLGESASDVLPAGFVHVLAFPVATALMTRADFPLPLLGMVHLANRVEQRRPVTLGDTLDVRAHARGLRAHRSGTQVELVTEVRVSGTGADSVPAWRGVSTYLARGVRIAGLDTSTPDVSDVSDVSDVPDVPDVSDVSDDARSRDRGGSDTSRERASTSHVSDEARVGERERSDTSREGASTSHVSDGARAGDRGGSDTSRRSAFEPPLPTGQWRLAADVGRRYAGVSGDVNPIHLSAPTARALGFPRAIAHGMYTASRALATVGAARTDAFTWSVEFAKPVLLPGTVAVRVAEERDRFEYAVWNGRSGKLHLTGDVVPH